jgi:hypothetical protein
VTTSATTGDEDFHKRKCLEEWVQMVFTTEAQRSQSCCYRGLDKNYLCVLRVSVVISNFHRFIPESKKSIPTQPEPGVLLGLRGGT